jgi:hypothetical protein
MLKIEKKVLEAARKKEAEIKNKNGKRIHEAVLLVENVLRKHSISKPYYHGGKYNGKAMNALMTNSQLIMDDVMQALLGIQEPTRGDDREVVDVASRFKKVLSTFDTFFLMARRKLGFFREEDRFDSIIYN